MSPHLERMLVCKRIRDFMSREESCRRATLPINFGPFDEILRPKITARRDAAADNDEFARLSLIRLWREEILAAKWLAHAISFAEHEWRFRSKEAARRLWVDVGVPLLKRYR